MYTIIHKGCAVGRVPLRTCVYATMPRDQVQVGYCGIPKFTSATLFTNKESHFLFHVKRKGGCPIFYSHSTIYGRRGMVRHRGGTMVRNGSRRHVTLRGKRYHYYYLKGGIRDEDDAGTSTCHPRDIHWMPLTDVPYDVP